MSKGIEFPNQKSPSADDSSMNFEDKNSGQDGLMGANFKISNNTEQVAVSSDKAAFSGSSMAASSETPEAAMEDNDSVIAVKNGQSFKDTSGAG